MTELHRALPVLKLLVRREFQTRYAGSTLGIVWNIIHPVVMVGIYILVFSSLMASRVGVQDGKLNYVIHLLSGMIPWILFQETVGRCTGTLVENAGFLKKLAMPAEILHVSVFLSSLIVHSFTLIVFTLLLLVAGVPVSPSVLLAIPAMVGLGLFGLGLGLILSVLNLVLRDIGQFVAIALNILFWLTPIVYFYSKSILPEGVMQALQFNPVLHSVSFVQSLYGSQGSAYQPGIAIPVMIALPIVSVVAGIVFLRRQRTEILDLL